MSFQIVDLESQAYEFLQDCSLKDLPDQGVGLVASVIEHRPDLLLDPLDCDKVILSQNANVPREIAVAVDLLGIDRRGNLLVAQICRGDKQKTLRDVRTILQTIADWSRSTVKQQALKHGTEFEQFVDGDAKVNHHQKLVLVAEASTFEEKEIAHELADFPNATYSINQFSVEQNSVSAAMFFMMHSDPFNSAHGVEYLRRDEREVVLPRVIKERLINAYFR